jgi:hypothetical protein
MPEERQCVPPSADDRVQVEEVRGDAPLGLGGEEPRKLGPMRRGAGSMPAACRIVQTVDGAIRCPSRANSPWILRWPHRGFSRAKRGKTLRQRWRGSSDDSAASQNRSGLVADRTVELSARHRVLTPQHEQFGVLGRVPAQQHADAESSARVGWHSSDTVIRAASQLLSEGLCAQLPPAAMTLRVPQARNLQLVQRRQGVRFHRSRQRRKGPVPYHLRLSTASRSPMAPCPRPRT